MEEQYDDRLEIDADAFIKLIERYPTIWNYNCHEYACKDARMEAWEKVCREFVDDYDEMSESKQESVSSQLQRKWKTLRDGFSRYLVQKRKSRPGRGPRTYHHFDQLSFLLKMRRKAYPNRSAGKSRQSSKGAPDSPEEPKPASIKEELQDNDDDDEVNEEEELPLVEASPLRVAQPQPPPQMSNTEFDGDKYFLLSLCNDFRQIPDEYKLSAKSEIIGVLKKYADMRSKWMGGSGTSGVWAE